MKAILFLLCNLLLSYTALHGKGYDGKILRIHSVVQRPDYDAPWSAKPAERMIHMGLVLGARHVLTAAYAVKDARQIEAEKLGDPRRYPLQVEFVDDLLNLAILRFVDQKPLGLEHIKFGDKLRLGESVDLWQALEGETLVSNAIKLREIEVKPLYLMEYGLPQYVFEMRRAGYGWFEPIMRDDRLVAVTLGQASGSIYALPSSLIQRFVEGWRNPPYRGLVEPGFQISTLLSPYLRRHLKAEEFSDGVVIRDVRSDSPFAGDLKIGDVLLEFNGTRISARGSYEHPRWGRINYLSLLADVYAGDELSLLIMREGRKIAISKRIAAYEPRHERVAPPALSSPNYLIFGGLLFQELSKSMLQRLGEPWQKKAPLAFQFQVEYQNQPSVDGSLHDVVLQKVLPLEFNRGYHDLDDLYVSRVNGRAIRNLRELRDALMDEKSRGQGYAHIFLEPGNREIILSYEGLESVHQTLARRYGIPKTAEFWHP